MATGAQSAADVLEEHRARANRHGERVNALERRANRISLLRLVLFLAGVVLGAAGVGQASYPMIGGGVALLALFGAAVVVHARTIAARDLAEIRRGVHLRHEKRLTGAWTELPHDGRGLLPADHAYAHDIDLLGAGSVFQRIDVTHTVRGARTLAAWLGEPAAPPVVSARQVAVRELARDLDFREELEAAAEVAAGADKLDAEPFLAFTRRERWMDGKAGLVVLIHVLPPATVASLVAWQLGSLTPFVFAGLLTVQLVLSYATARHAHATFDLVAARRGFVEAFARMLVHVERAKLTAPALKALQEKLKADGATPSEQLARLDRWAGFAELRTQGLVHIFVNPLVLWDLHVLKRLEDWNRSAGEHAGTTFDALGQIEALASLATLHHGDPTTSFPEVADGGALEARMLAHPLLPADSRVANDVALPGAGTALIVTGSNMAGKSTLLRSVGVNVALALAGGPVTARDMRVPRVRLRASMRANDDLQRGASYFHAELTKLKGVVADADESPPILFLLDELLRGTNARARHVGARAVLMHLLSHRAMGLVATHDVALSALEDEHPGQIGNAHFTDVMTDGEMYFDYKLQPGVVRHSNALHLLRLAGIEVPEDDTLTG